MVAGVNVKINDATVISALNTPGGLVADWRNDVERDLLERVYLDSPVNDVLNTLHDETRPPVGDFQRSWVTNRHGNGHRIGFTIENFSEHAIFVEEGRSGSTRIQVFSWTEWGGDVRAVGWKWGTGTKPRDGRHILRDTANRVLAAATGGAYTPLV